MALGYILISVLHIFSFSSMFLSSPLLFIQLLPQTFETHSEILENHLQGQKKNFKHATSLWPGYTKLSANFIPFLSLRSTEIKLEVEATCGVRVPSAREGPPDWSTSLHCPFWTPVPSPHVRMWTTYQPTPSICQGDAHPVPCLHHQGRVKQVCWDKAVSLWPVLNYFRSPCLRAEMRSHWNKILKWLWVCIIFSSDVQTSKHMSDISRA